MGGARRKQPIIWKRASWKENEPFKIFAKFERKRKRRNTQ